MAMTLTTHYYTLKAYKVHKVDCVIHRNESLGQYYSMIKNFALWSLVVLFFKPRLENWRTILNQLSLYLL